MGRRVADRRGAFRARDHRRPRPPGVAGRVRHRGGRPRAADAGFDPHVRRLWRIPRRDPNLHPRAGRLGGAAFDHERLATDRPGVLPLPARGRAGLRSRDQPLGPIVRADLSDRRLRQRATRPSAAAPGLEVAEPDRGHPADSRFRRERRVGGSRAGGRGADPRRDHRRRRRHGAASGGGARRPATLGPGISQVDRQVRSARRGGRVDPHPAEERHLSCARRDP